MAGEIASLETEAPLLRDDYSRGGKKSRHQKRRAKKRNTTRQRGVASMPGKHPGFNAVQSQIAAKEGIPLKNAGAILASSSRNASAAAKKKNPALNRVKGAASKSAPKKKKKKPGFPKQRGPSPIVQAMTGRLASPGAAGY